MSNQLREYQIELVERIHENFLSNQSVLLQMPTGTGKTMVFCKIIQDYLKEYTKKRVFVLVHREELLLQTQRQLYNNWGLVSGTIKSNTAIDINFRVHVCMVQTLVNMTLSGIDYYPSLLIIDEAHHTASRTYEKILKYITNEQTKLLGVSATPTRLDGKLLCLYFKDIIVSQPIKWFIQNNYLSKIKYYGINNINLKALRTSLITHEYEEVDAFRLMNDNAVMKDVLSSYEQFAKNKKTLIFAVNQRHSMSIKERFEAAGYLAEIVDSKTNKGERNTIIDRFKKNEINILINVQIFTEGFDCPDIDVVILARPTKSITLYLQMIGRVTRNPNYPENNIGLILDNAGNWKELGLPTQSFDWAFEFNPGGSCGRDTGGWFTVPHNNKNELIIKNPRLPKEIQDLEMKEIRIDGDESYEESLEEENDEIVIKTELPNDQEILPKNIVSLGNNTYYMNTLDNNHYLFYCYSEDINDVLANVIFNRINDYRKYIIDKCQLISNTIIELNLNDTSVILLQMISSFDEINSKINLNPEIIPSYKKLNPNVPNDDIANRIFAWLWSKLKKNF